RGLDVTLGGLGRKVRRHGTALERRLILPDVAERGDRLAVAPVGLEPQRVGQRLLVVAERHRAAPGQRRIEPLVVVGELARVVELGLADPDLDVEVAVGVVAVDDQRAALGVEVDHALFDQLVRQVVRGILLLAERGHLALVLGLEHVEDRRVLVGRGAVRRGARRDLDRGGYRGQVHRTPVLGQLGALATRATRQAGLWTTARRPAPGAGREPG